MRVEREKGDTQGRGLEETEKVTERERERVCDVNVEKEPVEAVVSVSLCFSPG